MSEQNKQIAREFYSAVSDGALDRLQDFLTEDFVEHEPFPGIPPNREGVTRFFSMLRSAFPDLRMEIEDMISEGDRLAVRGRMEGTHDGEFMGVPATGKQINVNIIDIVRVEDGRAAEHWGATDTMTLLQQIGALPEAAPA